MITNLIDKIIEFFHNAFVLSFFAIKTLWVILKDDMKKNSQTYKEEREEQKRAKNKKK
jgi:large-conductance mechanosensitive channel